MTERTTIPPEIAADVLFAADHTCCVCHVPLMGVQIHHIDEDPSNHAPGNLALLCFEDHDRTQRRGGFGRQLGAEEVVRYRDDWNAQVRAKRAAAPAPAVRAVEVPEAPHLMRLRRARAVATVTRQLVDVLPGTPFNDAGVPLSFPGVARDLGVPDLWIGGSKTPAVGHLLTETLNHHPTLFGPLITEIVVRGMMKHPESITRPRVVAIIDALALVGVDIPELRDPAFLGALPTPGAFQP